MGHSTASGRTASAERVARPVAEALGTTNDALIERSQRIIQTLKVKGSDFQRFEVASPETNLIYSGEAYKDPIDGGYRLSLDAWGRSDRILSHVHYDNLRDLKNAIYETTKIPKAGRGAR